MHTHACMQVTAYPGLKALADTLVLAVNMNYVDKVGQVHAMRARPWETRDRFLTGSLVSSRMQMSS